MKATHLQILETGYGLIKGVEKISRWRECYRIEFAESVVRVDILKPTDSTIEAQKFILENGVFCVPFVLDVIPAEDMCLKISSWVEGKLYSDYVESDSLT